MLEFFSPHRALLERQSQVSYILTWYQSRRVGVPYPVTSLSILVTILNEPPALRRIQLVYLTLVRHDSYKWLYMYISLHCYHTSLTKKYIRQVGVYSHQTTMFYMAAPSCLHQKKKHENPSIVPKTNKCYIFPLSSYGCIWI